VAAIVGREGGRLERNSVHAGLYGETGGWLGDGATTHRAAAVNAGSTLGRRRIFPSGKRARSACGGGKRVERRVEAFV
jgi:hypothetical protein